VIAEAGAACLPVVSTRHAGIPEMIEDGATGLLAGERDPVGLAAALCVLARDPVRRQAMGDAAHARAKASFDVARMAADYARVCAIRSFR